MSFDVIKKVKAGLHRDEIGADQAVLALLTRCDKEELADFIVGAFINGWVTNHQLGLNCEGKPK